MARAAASRDHSPREGSEGALEGLEEEDLVDDSTRAVGGPEGALDSLHRPSDETCPRAEHSLGERERERRCRRQQRCCAERPRLGDVGGEDRERSPGEREDQVVVDRAAEQLDVVRDDEEDAESDERDEHDADPVDTEPADAGGAREDSPAAATSTR